MKPLFTLFLFLVCPIIAGAQIYVKHDATGNLEGTSWQDAYTDLQNAIEVAGAGDQIWVAAGTYIPVGFTPKESHFIAEQPIEIYGGFNGAETSLEERDWEANPTILSGDINGDDTAGDFLNNRTDNAHHVLILDSREGEFIIDGILFKGGITQIDPPVETDIDTLYHRWRGGALYVRRSNALIQHCTFTDNYGFQGSGLFAGARYDVAYEVTVRNSIFELNGATQGGACFLADMIQANVYNCEFKQNESNVFGPGLVLRNINSLVEDCVFELNTANSYGGACYVEENLFTIYDKPVIVFKNSIFTNNSAGSYGGAIRLDNRVKGYSFTIDSCIFDKNTVTNSWGGAIDIEDYHDGGSDVTEDVYISNTTFSENEAYFGSAVTIVAADDSMHINISNTDFLNNTHVGGGGSLYLYMIGTSKVDLQMRQSLFEGNTGQFLGAMAMESSNNAYPIVYTIDDCDFIDNTAIHVGGAIRSTGLGARPVGIIKNSSFIGNIVGGWGGAIYTTCEMLAIEHCLFEDNEAGGIDSLYGIRGGGAIYAGGYPGLEAVASISTSIFKNNGSQLDGGAIYFDNKITASIANSLLEGNTGTSSILNSGTLSLLNTTSVANAEILLLGDTSTTTFQNNIMQNLDGNLNITGKPVIISLGGNISSDNSTPDFLTGFGAYEDWHDTDPLLGPDFVPMTGSPAINAGNPSGVKNATDLAGNPRIMGGAIDAGSFEALSTSTQHILGDNIRLQISPNPVADVLTIAFDGKIEAMQVMTMDGKLMHAVPSILESKQINISDLIPGQYILQIQSASKWYSAQFSKM